MKAVEIPDPLADQVRALGEDLGSFVVKAVEEKLPEATPIQGTSLGEKVRNGWIPPTIQGKSPEGPRYGPRSKRPAVRRDAHESGPIWGPTHEREGKRLNKI